MASSIARLRDPALQQQRASNMKLQTLKPRLQATNSARVQALPPQPTERKRGWAGVQDRMRIRQCDVGECQACKRAGKFSLGGPVDHIGS
jgi:hypothetical protein